MHLPHKIFVLAAIATTFGCHEDVGPPAPSRAYFLANVNGRSLPTFLSPIPESGTIVSGALFLGASRDAMIIQHRLQMGTDVTDTASYTYQINGSAIAFDYNPPCPPNALCVAPPKGTIVGSGFDLDMSGGSGGSLYSFRFFAPD